MNRILVVANQTAESEELLGALKARADEGQCEFTLLVPATPHGVSWAADMFAGGEEAEEHLQAMVERLRKTGLPIKEAKVGDPDALAAIQDVCNFGSYDEVIVSTLPLHLSKWLKVDLPHKVEHATGLPVLHVEASR
jgi:nucleotide-binding universal stress UspA family protein